MKKLLLGALCLLSGCQLNPQKQSVYIPLNAGISNAVLNARKQDSIAIKTTVKVVDYSKKLFKVYTLAGHFYAGAVSGTFNRAEWTQKQIDRYMDGYCDTIKFIVSNPLTLKDLYAVKKYQYEYCEKAISEDYFNKHRKNVLDKIARMESNNVDSLQWDGGYYTDSGGQHYFYKKFGKY